MTTAKTTLAIVFLSLGISACLYSDIPLPENVYYSCPTGCPAGWICGSLTTDTNNVSKCADKPDNTQFNIPVDNPDAVYNGDGGNEPHVTGSCFGSVGLFDFCQPETEPPWCGTVQCTDPAKPVCGRDRTPNTAILACIGIDPGKFPPCPTGAPEGFEVWDSAGTSSSVCAK